jgi:hypothetical protein
VLGTSTRIRRDARAIGWALAVGLAAGAIVGVLVGGVGGRLAMLLLRLTSTDYVIGVVSDDGFEIGQVTTKTFQLLLATAAFGGVFGVLYAVARVALPPRLRIPLWTLTVTALVGAAIVHEDGVDFRLIQPAGLAVALFVALPAAAAAGLALLVERWMRTEPWTGRRARVVVAGSVLGTVAIVPALVVFGAVLAARSVGIEPALRRAAQVVVPVVLVLAVVTQGVELVQTTIRVV